MDSSEPHRFALSIGLGPVGSFIAAGRRSRDLWWGSTWLSECTAEVARRVHLLGEERGLGVELQLPSHARLFQPSKARHLVGDSYRAFEDRVSNHVRAIVMVSTGAEDLRRLVVDVESAAHRWLEERTRGCLRRAEQRIAKDGSLRRLDISLILDHDRFRQQLEAIARGDFIHFTAAWAPVDGADPEHHAPALHRADELMIAARRSRPFAPPDWSRAGSRKSDLDAGRDGVLHERISPAQRKSARLARAALGIGESEQLDALGFARRIAAFERRSEPEPDATSERDGNPELGRLPFPPIGRIAIEPWIERVQKDPATHATLRALTQRLLAELRRSRTTFLAWCTPACDPTGHSKGRLDDESNVFPFDPSILWQDGVSAVCALLEKLEPEDLAEALHAIKRRNGIQDRVLELHRRHGIPHPYYALIEADGDGVGSALAKAETSKCYSDLVDRLDAYADGLDRKLRPEGCRAFYVGGDDALVLAPLHHLTKAMRIMQSHFAECMKEPDFTLSFGVVVAHVKDDLRWVRRQATDAIRSAKRKRPRKELGPSPTFVPTGWAEIREQPRAGALRTCDGALLTLLDSIDSFVHAIAEDQISQRTPQLMLELEPIVNVGHPTDDERRRLAEVAMELACQRVLAQARRSAKKAEEQEDGERPPPTAVEAEVRAILGKDHADPWRRVVDLAARIQLAARLATAAGAR